MQSSQKGAFNWQPGEDKRVSLLPIMHDDLWKFRKKVEALHWTPQEVDLSRDLKSWERMSPEERHYIKTQFAFFARIDIDVLDNLDANFGKEVDCMEARMFYAAQKDQECVHVESYGLQIMTVMTGDERDAVFNAVRTMPIIKRMRDWALHWFDSSLDIGERLIAFAAVEGVLFSASFSALQWLRERNLLPGITDFNAFIVRDEGIHTLFTCLLVKKYLRKKPSQACAEEIFRSIVALLDEFIKEALPSRLIDMNDELQGRYVRYQADSVLSHMGYSSIFGIAENPLPFMEKLTLNEVAKTNFFEHRPTQYQNVSRPGQTKLAIDDSPVEC